MALGHSNWTIWSPQNLFLQNEFLPLEQGICSIPYYSMQGKGYSLMDIKSEWEQGVYDPWALKLDHMQSTKPTFAKLISASLTSHMQHSFSSMQGKGHSMVDLNSERPGAFKLGHMQSKKPMFAKWISTSLTGHMQHSLFQHAGERALHNGCQKWMRARGIQIGPFGVHKSYFLK